MTGLRIVPLYAALLAIMFVALSVRVIRLRRRLKVAIGDKSEPELKRAVRVHGNFAEYVPFALLLLAFVELTGVGAWTVHALCALLLIGRLSHAYGVSQVNETFRFRVVGTASTFAVLIVSALLLLATVLA